MIHRVMRSAPLLACLCLATSGCQTAMMLGGESVLCGDPSRVRFQLARFASERTGQPVWSSSRYVSLTDSIGVEGESVRDIRIVTIGKKPTFTFGAEASQTGEYGTRQTGGTEPDQTERRDWNLRVALDSDAARRLEETVESIAGTYSVVAFVVGDQVVSASVDLPVSAGIAQIELATTRSVEEGRELFRSELGCTQAPSGDGDAAGAEAGG